MNERQRILELVKKGILSTEEGLDLLESMAQAKDEAQLKKAADKVDSYHKEQDKAAHLVDEWENKAADDETKSDQPTKEDELADLENYFADLASEANKISVHIDATNLAKKELEASLAEKKENLMELDTKEELGTLSEEDEAIRSSVEAEIKSLEQQILEQAEEVAEQEAKLAQIKQDQKQKPGQRNYFDLPDDLKDQATETFTQVGEKLGEAGLQLGRLAKKTFKSVSETVENNVDWKDINLKVPGVATTKFEHQFVYTDVAPTLIDVKLANGKVTFNLWDEDKIQVDAKIKLYGKMNEATPFDSLMARSQIEVNDDHISFQLPNKRVNADLTFNLPRRTYDHVAVKLLNGHLDVNNLEAKDVYAKTTNGNIWLKQINATMVEIEGVNGNITIDNGKILDSIIETVNGTITLKADIENYGISLINGDIKITAGHADVKKIKASSVNGNVKVALPTEIGLEAIAKTNFGSINQRMNDYEVVREKTDKTNRLLQFRRTADEMIQVDVSTTSGSIFLKDFDK